MEQNPLKYIRFIIDKCINKILRNFAYSYGEEKKYITCNREKF